LPNGAEVHHVNGSKDSGPLVICQDRSYHLLLHQRTRAFLSCGSVDWLRCPYCKKYDDPKNMYVRNGHGRHKKCQAEYETLRLHKRNVK
jgi:hypothetical protein